MSQNLEKTIDYIISRIEDPVDALVVLGSGLDSFKDHFTPYQSLEYKSVPGFPMTTAPGHEGVLYFSKWKEKHLAIMAGRIHSYEGCSQHMISFPIKVFHHLGISKLILTNASGGLQERIKIGVPLVVEKFINFSQKGILEFKEENKVSYAYMQGPNFGTLAEYKLLQKIGVDLVGMSTLPEFVAANKLGLNSITLSLPVCNYSLTAKEPSEDELNQVADAAIPQLFEMINQLKWD